MNRDDHLFGAGTKRILALDGGGVRGAITLAFLERIESLLQRRFGPSLRLSDYFDFIGGTSSGAILAGGVALGLSTSELRDFFLRLAPSVFHRSIWRLAGLQSKFDSRRLQRELEAVYGPISLDSDKLKTGLCVVLKRMDTASAWVITNSPRSKYWNDPPDRSYVGNRQYKLATLVRGSAAAPHYFDPEVLQISENSPPGLFVDGALTPYNNPALLLLLVTTLPQYGIKWAHGADKLRIVSVGAGRFKDLLSVREAKRTSAVGVAIRSLTGMISEADTLTLGLMQALSVTKTPWVINSEAGTMEGLLPDRPLFEHLRYDMLLEHTWVENLGFKLDAKTLARLRRIDDPGSVALAYQMATKAAELQIRDDHFDDDGFTFDPAKTAEHAQTHNA
jgi:uncharacterized protein